MKRKKLVEKYEELFASQIIYRGKEYYEYDKVLSVYKSDYKYIAKVEGSNCEEYNVIIEYGKMGMIIRIAYRKGNKTVKKNINNWIEKIKDNDCYNDIFLEDMILTIK